MMEKLPMCRICLVANVHSRIQVVNKNLHEVYEKLTDIPFVTEDRRPMLACFFCCAKLKQCYRLLRQCLEAEKLFAQMMNEDYEPNPLINQEFFSGFIRSPTENISIVDVVQTESIAVKEELPPACERLYDIIQPKEEHQSGELEPENFDNSWVDVPIIKPHHSESDLEDDVPLMEIKIEVEEEQALDTNNIRGAMEMTRATVAKKPKLDKRRLKLEDATTAEQTKKEKSVSKVGPPGSYFKEPNKCDQRSCNPVKKSLQHTRKQIGKTPYKCDLCQRNFNVKSRLSEHNIRKHSSEKPFKCDVCQSSFCRKSELTKHIRIHTGEKPFKCNICLCSFSTNWYFTNHIREHTGEKPYLCDVCQRSFSQKRYLTTHKRIHTGEKPFECDVCQRSFSHESVLTKHIRIHTSEKPYLCDVCQRSFSQKRYLTKHKRIHTGEKPFEFDVPILA